MSFLQAGSFHYHIYTKNISIAQEANLQRKLMRLGKASASQCQKCWRFGEFKRYPARCFTSLHLFSGVGLFQLSLGSGEWA